MTASSTGDLTAQMLAWIACSPRTYAEVMEAWRTSCPRLSVWEDAVLEGLIDLRRDATGKATMVFLSERGAASLSRLAAATSERRA